MKFFRLLSPSFLIAALFIATACSESNAPEANSTELPTIALGSTALRMEFALTRDQQRRGLMHRESIDEDYGMLFVFDAPQHMSFYMRNVPFPIDIGFFTADGVLRETYPMYAHDEQTRHSVRDDLVYALEVSSGWFRRNGVKVGDALELVAVSKATRQAR